MLNKKQARDVARAAEAVDRVLLDAVAQTVAEPGPEPARHILAELLRHDDRPEFGDGGPARMMAFIALAGRLTDVRAALADRPDRVEQVLGWVGEQLGPRFRARSRYTSGMLVDDAAANETSEYVDALREDYLPSLVWLLAGAVARYGDGDVGWLQEIEART